MKPMNIFNMDETGVTIVHKGGKVVTEVGRRNVWAITSAEKGKTHTIISCVSASGYVLPPFLIYPRQRIMENLKIGAIPGTVFHCSDSGWVNADCRPSSLSEILALPKPLAPNKNGRKPAVNAKANCITDTEVLKDLQSKRKKKKQRSRRKQ